jgi:predicted nucleic acid-binding Zn ribbon protein
MESIHQFASGVLADIVKRQPASAERTRFAWQLAVGPALARVTTIDLRDGVLFVTARDEQWRAEIARAQGAILAKLQHLLGAESVRKIRT